VALTGGKASHPLVEHLRSVETVESLPDPPGLDDLRSAWLSLSEELLRQIPALTQAKLRQVSPDAMPVADPSVLGALAFLLQHESYHVGQLAMLKKHLTGRSMRYSSRGGQ
jgi:uncharacterized damage-inducible protein DinB